VKVTYNCHFWVCDSIG